MTRRYQPWRTKPLPLPPPPEALTAVARWQTRLELGQWGEIPVYVRNLTDGRAAEVRWSNSYKGAAIALDRRWLAAPHRTAADIESTIVHELLHLVFAEMDDALETLLGLGSAFMTYADKREGLCDILAALFMARYKRARREA